MRQSEPRPGLPIYTLSMQKRMRLVSRKVYGETFKLSLNANPNVHQRS
eukprot:COSAG02_NODE_65721_length_257_cov_0.708861_1_plen_47_part_01